MSVAPCIHVSQEHARWHITYSTGPLSAEKANVTVSAFGSKPDGCDNLPVVVASPEDGCSPLLNVEQVWGEGFAGRAREKYNARASCLNYEACVRVGRQTDS